MGGEIGPEGRESGERSPLGGEGAPPRVELRCCEKIGSRPEIGRGILAVKNVTHEQKKVRSPDQPEFSPRSPNQFRGSRLKPIREPTANHLHAW